MFLYTKIHIPIDKENVIAKWWQAWLHSGQHNITEFIKARLKIGSIRSVPDAYGYLMLLGGNPLTEAWEDDSVQRRFFVALCVSVAENDLLQRLWWICVHGDLVIVLYQDLSDYLIIHTELWWWRHYMDGLSNCIGVALCFFLF